MNQHGTQQWTLVAKMLKVQVVTSHRSGKQCRERWHNHLDPKINKGPISHEEERMIFRLLKRFGNKWAMIAKHIPGRSDNCIKNYYYSTTRKHKRRIDKMLKTPQIRALLGYQENAITADLLYSLVAAGNVTYD